MRSAAMPIDTKKIFPIGDRSFRSIREGNFYYVDKTEHIFRLFSNETRQHFLLTRPRRFGKTLLVSAMKELFLGNKELFEGLYIYDKWDWSTSYPVIHIDFAQQKLDGNRGDLLFLLEVACQNTLAHYHIEIPTEKYVDRATYYFQAVLRELANKSKKGVIVLIDEYDKPLLDSVITPQQEQDLEKGKISQEDYWAKRRRYDSIREALRNLYTAIKGNKEYIRFAFLTGITRYAEGVSHSGFNSVKDISLQEEYSTICGYTEKEIEENFPEELKKVDRELLRKWYDGYTWGGPHIYNPIDVMECLNSKEFFPYWEDTGAASRFLFEMTKNKFATDPFRNINTLSKRALLKFDVANPDLAALLFQTGYLTLASPQESKRYDSDINLKFPNYEVELSYKQNLADHLLNNQINHDKIATTSEKICRACVSEDIHAIETYIRAALSYIPSIWYKKDALNKYEGYFATVILLLFYGIGDQYLNPEEWVHNGRLDLRVTIGSLYYIFEFKMVDMSTPNYKPGVAIQQIEDRGYYKPFEQPGNTIYLVGVEIDVSSAYNQRVEFQVIEKLK